MRVAVIGAGAIGGLYGGVLARAGHSVSLLARGAQLAAIRAHGLHVTSADFGEFTVDVPAASDPADLEKAEVALFAVKTYDLETAARAASALVDNTGCLITFQNGLEAPDQVARIAGEQRVLIGTTRVEATIAEPGVISQPNPGHVITIGEFDGPPSPRVEHLVAEFKAAGLNAVASPNARRALWEKASVLIPMATATSVCRAPVGPIRELPESRELLMRLFGEVKAVAAAYGHDLGNTNGPAGLTLESAPASMTTSMARDFERGRRTELDALTGALVRLGEARGVDAPTARTAYAILKLRQSLDAAGAPEPIGNDALRR